MKPQWSKVRVHMDPRVKREAVHAACGPTFYLVALCGQKAPTRGEYLTEVWLCMSVEALINTNVPWQKETEWRK